MRSFDLPIETLDSQIRETASFLTNRLKAKWNYQTAVVLGSGLKDIFNATIQIHAEIQYKEIPHWPLTSVEGHPGKLILGTLNNLPVVLLVGRVHRYEGHAPHQVIYPLRVLKHLGMKVQVLTNASGSVNPAIHPGEIVIVTDHINLTGENPLVGVNYSVQGKRFPAMNECYHPRLITYAKECFTELGIKYREGIYAGVLGPNYETPAEVRMIRQLGADIVGMSTVFEVIAAAHMNVANITIAGVTNMGSGLSSTYPSHDKIQAEASQHGKKMAAVISLLMKKIISEDLLK